MELFRLSLKMPQRRAFHGAPPKRRTTWYLQGRSEISSTPSAASGTTLWCSVGVIRIKLADGLETRYVGFIAPHKPTLSHISRRESNTPQRGIFEDIVLLPAVCPEQVGFAVKLLRVSASCLVHCRRCNAVIRCSEPLRELDV